MSLPLVLWGTLDACMYMYYGLLWLAVIINVSSYVIFLLYIHTCTANCLFGVCVCVCVCVYVCVCVGGATFEHNIASQSSYLSNYCRALFSKALATSADLPLYH